MYKRQGENKPEPTFEIPREAPKVEIPEFNGGIPGIPEERVKPVSYTHLDVYKRQVLAL